MQEHVIQHIHLSIETHMQTGETLAGPLADASQRLVQTLLNDRKIFVAGNGSSAALGQFFVTTLINRLEHERPSLPAIALNADSSVITGLANDGNFNDVFARQIRALGQPGDMLVMLAPTGNASNLVQALATAHDKQIAVILLSGNDGGNLATLLDEGDVELRAPSTMNSQIHEAHLLSILNLCELIDSQLFGTG